MGHDGGVRVTEAQLRDAYQAHLQTPDSLKYKSGTKEMVKSIELIKRVPIFRGVK